MVSILDKTVLEHLADAHLLESDAAECQKLAGEAVEKAKEMIVSGEGTGDSLRDYVIVTMGKDSENLTELLHGIEEVLADKVGELILFVYTWEEDLVKHTISPRHGIFGTGTATMSNLHLGVISGKKLVVNPQEGFCDFSIERLLEYGSKRNYFGIEKSPGEEVIQNILLKESRDFLQRIVPVTPFEQWEFKIGSDDIVEWIEGHPGYSDGIVGMSDELGVSL
jgi:hypothetical protein